MTNETKTNTVYLICEDDKGFEDQLTEGSIYMVEGFGVNGYKVYDDNEVERWFGESKFSLVFPKEL